MWEVCASRRGQPAADRVFGVLGQPLDGGPDLTEAELWRGGQGVLKNLHRPLWLEKVFFYPQNDS